MTHAKTLITDREARDIAFAWHGGQATALYAFASTGAIYDQPAFDTAFEVQDALFSATAPFLVNPSEEDLANERDLRMLLDYLQAHGARPRPNHWRGIPWN